MDVVGSLAWRFQCVRAIVVLYCGVFGFLVMGY